MLLIIINCAYLRSVSVIKKILESKASFGTVLLKNAEVLLAKCAQNEKWIHKICRMVSFSAVLLKNFIIRSYFSFLYSWIVNSVLMYHGLIISSLHSYFFTSEYMKQSSFNFTHFIQEEEHIRAVTPAGTVRSTVLELYGEMTSYSSTGYITGSKPKQQSHFFY